MKTLFCGVFEELRGPDARSTGPGVEMSNSSQPSSITAILSSSIRGHCGVWLTVSTELIGRLSGLGVGPALVPALVDTELRGRPEKLSRLLCKQGFISSRSSWHASS